METIGKQIRTSPLACFCASTNTNQLYKNILFLKALAQQNTIRNENID